MDDHDDNIIEIPDDMFDDAIERAFPAMSDEAYEKLSKAFADAAQALSDAISVFCDRLIDAFDKVDWAAIADAIADGYERMNEQDAEGTDLFGDDPAEPENEKE